MSIFSKLRVHQALKEIEKKTKVKRYVNFTLGCLLVAIAYNLFLASNDIVSGGIGGIAIILNELIGISNALVMLIFNIFLLILSYFLLGKDKTKATILGSLLLPLFIELTSHINIWLELDTSQLLVSSVFGGVMYGFGLGMIFKAGFTTGGTDIVNQILSKYAKMSIGKSMLLCDGTIVLLSGLVFGATHVMYAIIVLYIISFISDRVILGVSDSKAFYIITDKEDTIKEYILKVLNHGVTVFNAQGGYKKDNQTVLMCVLPTKDYYRLKAGINEIDSEAFVVVTDAYEVFGGE
ncbi:MAG: YitT family protein [Bacilli bacterium]|nr:YitT family protein [Bacilli bacterium]